YEYEISRTTLTKLRITIITTTITATVITLAITIKDNKSNNNSTIITTTITATVITIAITIKDNKSNSNSTIIIPEVTTTIIITRVTITKRVTTKITVAGITNDKCDVRSGKKKKKNCQSENSLSPKTGKPVN
ncbi:hypothetical protein LOAG_13607, partial [Loa loa]